MTQTEIAHAAIDAREWDSSLSPTETPFNEAMAELDAMAFDNLALEDEGWESCVYAAVGRGFENTAELKPMKYNETQVGESR
jgi:hypothetical protein